MATVSVAVID